MNARKAVPFAALCVFALAVSAAASPFMGTWKLNEAKSKIPVGVGKVMTVTYEAAGADIKCTVDGTDASGNANHSEWTGKFDGKDYPVTGDPSSDMRSYKMLGARTLMFSNKKGGKVNISGKIVLSADGKSRTVTTTATDANGKKTTFTAVYDKQ